MMKDKDNNSVLMEFGEAIRSLREKQGITQEELAYKSGVHVTYLSGIESGNRNPTLKVIQRLACGLGVSISALFSRG